MPEEDDSLLVFEEEEEFDPLKRSNSMNRSSSFSSNRTGSIGSKPVALQTKTQQQTTTTEGQNSLLGALSGIDLSSATAQQQQPLQQQEQKQTTNNILAQVLQPVQTTTAQVTIVSNANLPYSQPPIQMGGVGQQPMGVAYAPMATTYGVGTTGGMMQRPMMYAPPGMVYMSQMPVRQI